MKNILTISGLLLFAILTGKLYGQGATKAAPVPAGIKIGDTYDGGIVFSITKGKDGSIHGLVCLNHSIAYSATWKEADDACNGWNTKRNTTGWRLPTKDELNLMYTKLQKPGLTESFSTSTYWSSTPDGADKAWAQDFGTGQQKSLAKSGQINGRPVRAF